MSLFRKLMDKGKSLGKNRNAESEPEIAEALQEPLAAPAAAPETAPPTEKAGEAHSEEPADTAASDESQEESYAHEPQDEPQADATPSDDAADKDPAGEERIDTSEYDDDDPRYDTAQDDEAAYDASSLSSENRMEEIYSTKDKHVKYRREQPLEAEEAAKRTAAAKDELKRGKLEIYFDEEDDVPEVRLEAELDPEAIVAEDIIEDVVDVKKLKGIFVQDINEIDISLEPAVYPHSEQHGASHDTSNDSADNAADKPLYASSSDAIVAKVPAYRHDSRIDNIFLKAGRFTDVVESEYDEYLRSTDPAVSHNSRLKQLNIKPHQSLLYTISQAATRHKTESAQKQKSKDVIRKNFDEEPIKQTKQDKPEKSDKPKKPTDPSKAKKAIAKKLEAGKAKVKAVKSNKIYRKITFSKTGRFFQVMRHRLYHKLASMSRADQYRSLNYNSREDEAYIAERIAKNRKRLVIHLGVYALFAIVMLSLVIWERTCGASVSGEGSVPALAYCAVNTVLLWALGIIARNTLLNGIKPLRRFKANSQTLIALAYVACLIQGMVSLFVSSSFVGANHHLYGFIIAFALLLDTAGRLMMVMRVKSNFDFITAHSPAYAAEIYDDEETARRMVSGTTASRGAIAYQHLTDFLSDFLKISYALDPSEELSGKTTPIAVISALVVAIIYAFIFKSVPGTVSALTVMLCIGIPFTAMVAGNLPMLLFSRRMLDNEAMVAGYPSVKRFCDTSALILSAADLFPSGCVTLDQLVPVAQYRVEEGLLMAAAVLREADSPIAPVFDELVMENKGVLPSVESVMYEDRSGLVGWIGGERVLIGNKKLMNRYHITFNDDFPMAKQKKLENNTTYIAVSGQAIAIMALTYQAAPMTKEQILKAEHSGIALVVSTTDANVTDDLVAERYGLFHRSVKVTAPGYTNVIDEVTGSVAKASRAYIATRGRIGSLARAIGGCIGIKTNIGLGIAIEIFGTILGLLLSATLALYASVSRLSVVELIIYIGFWVAATVIAELIRRP